MGVEAGIGSRNKISVNKNHEALSQKIISYFQIRLRRLKTKNVPHWVQYSLQLL